MEMVDYDDPMKNGPDDHTPAERQAMYDQSVLHAKDLNGNFIWHDWDGRMSTSPVSPEMFIDVKIRCGEVIENFKAGTFCWKHSDNEDAVFDIVSFRPSYRMLAKSMYLTLRDETNDPDNPWIEWLGHQKSPHPQIGKRAKIDVIYRSGVYDLGVYVDAFRWFHDGRSMDIMFYRQVPGSDVTSPKLSMVRTFGKQPFDWPGVGKAVEITWTLYLNGVLILSHVQHFPWTSYQSVMDACAPKPYPAIQTLHDNLAKALSLS